MVKQLKLKASVSAKLDRELSDLNATQSKYDYIVDFYASELNIQNRVVNCTFSGSSVKWDNYLYKAYGRESKNHFVAYYCTKHDKSKCGANIRIPKNAEVGKVKAILSDVGHVCMSSLENYDDNGRSIHLNRLFDAISTLIVAGIDANTLFGEDEFNWPDNMPEEVQDAADCFTECYYLNEKFENKFTEEKGSNYSVYARFKEGVSNNTQIEEMFANFGYVGQRSGTGRNRMTNERRERMKNDWFNKIKFFVHSRPIKASHLLIPSTDFHTGLCEKQAKAEEALIEKLFIKLPDKEKLVFNTMYDNFDEKYAFKSWKKTLKNAAFILCRGLFTAKIRLDDYRLTGPELKARLTELNKVDESIFIESTSLFKPTLALKFTADSEKVNVFLQAHTNGFRYTTLRGEKIDILYKNIKHAFFQPYDNEMPILLYFNLKSPVLVNDEELLDIQIGAEIGEVVNENDETLSSQELNSMFQSFCKDVKVFTKGKIRFEKLRNELGFTGVPFDLTVTLKPTSTCLVSLTEMPTLIVPLDEIELVHFERANSNTRSFDLVIVFKDYEKKTQQIDSIPAQSLDSVKDWLNSCDIHYSEGPMSLNWKNIMKTIVQDPEAFFTNGGWGRLKSDEFNIESGEPAAKRSKNG